MSLVSGTRIGSYEILAPLGAGGMGEVYRAKDAKLGREVAIKVLPPEVSGDPERRARFEQEARAASALNHPNIITIHDIGTSDSTVYIAMEFVDGKTLREVLVSGPLAVKKALEIAGQVADGLAKAHSAGIVHRDLKPENLMLTKDGFVKILDFGLAKLAEPFSEAASQLPTAAALGTRPGMVLGTVGYMSPEQASGEPLDFRSDQFSFGAILYEMATGKRAFQRNTAAETLSAIIREEPQPITSVNPEAPTPLRWVVERCLSKDPEERYAATRDLARDLKQALTHISEPLVQVAEFPKRKRLPKQARFAALAVVLLAVVGVGVYLGTRGRQEPKRPAAKLTKVTFAPGLEDEPTWSPDGKFLACTTDERGNLDIVVLPLGGGEPIRVAGSEADEAQPSWSPDGTKLAFVSARDRGGRLSIVLGQGPGLGLFLQGKGGDIFIVPALGGSPAKLVEDGYYPAWSPDGKKIVFQSIREGQWDLWVVSAEGGTPTRLTDDANFDFQPSWSPDGKWIAYGSGVVPIYNVRVVPAEGGQPRDLTRDKSWVIRPAWSSDGKSVLFSAERNGIVNIWKVPFSPSPDAKEAPPERVTIGEGPDVSVSVSRDGEKVAFASVRSLPDIWELTLASGDLRQVTSETSFEDYPRISPDGKTLLAVSNRSGKLAVWTLDLNGRVLAQLAPSGEQAQWSPDGQQIVYFRDQTIRIQRIGGMSARDTGVKGVSPAWSPDGEKIAFGSGPPDITSEISVYSVKAATVKPLTHMRSRSVFPSWSPDGREIAFQAEREGTRHIWIVPAEGGEPRQITRGESEDSHPQWSSRNRDEILFLRDHKTLCLVSVSTGKVRELPSYREGSFMLDYPSWSPDGGRVYFSVSRKTGDVYVLEGY